MLYNNKKHKVYPHVSKGRFYNYPTEKKQGFLIPSLRMLLDWQLNRQVAQKHEVEQWISLTEPIPHSESLAITWIGHSTFLIQIGGYNILTDPIFGDLAFLFRRITTVGIAPHKLPSIDFVLISHNHRDHMDAQSLKTIAKHNPLVQFMVPQGDAAWFKRNGLKGAKENMWWDVEHHSSLTLTFLPAFHWSQRGLFDYNRSLWGSWMIEYNGTRIYFAGDTAYSSHFHSIAEEYSSIDIALMPIGPCEPRTWMSHAHVSAEEAGQAFIDLNARHFIPMHWGTYYFGLDSFDLPYKRLVSWWVNQNFIDKRLSVLKVGERIIPAEPTLHIPSYSVLRPQV